MLYFMIKRRYRSLTLPVVFCVVETMMTTVTVELTSDLYSRLQREAERLGQPPEKMAQEILMERLEVLPAPTAKSERERVREALQAAGMLAELSPQEKQLAAQSTMSLEEVRRVLDRSEGKPLSEIVLEMRGPKE
jgi:predicted transcriptional regulator